MKKRIYAVILATALLISGCSAMNVYDNEERIQSNTNSYNKFNYKQSTHNDTTTITCAKMEGMDTVWSYQTDEDIDLQMCYTFEVASGKAKLVLIQPDGSVITLLEQESAEETESQPTNEINVGEDDDTASTAGLMCTLELKKGTNRMKIVCEKDTSFTLSYTIPEA